MENGNIDRCVVCRVWESGAYNKYFAFYIFFFSFVRSPLFTPATQKLCRTVQFWSRRDYTFYIRDLRKNRINVQRFIKYITHNLNGKNIQKRIKIRLYVDGCNNVRICTTMCTQCVYKCMCSELYTTKIIKNDVVKVKFSYQFRKDSVSLLLKMNGNRCHLGGKKTTGGESVCGEEPLLLRRVFVTIFL